MLPRHLRYAEQWESEEALHAHIRSSLYHRLLEALELSQREPEVKFYYCSEIKGLELIEAARRDGDHEHPTEGAHDMSSSA